MPTPALASGNGLRTPEGAPQDLRRRMLRLPLPPSDSTGEATGSPCIESASTAVQSCTAGRPCLGDDDLGPLGAPLYHHQPDLRPTSCTSRGDPVPASFRVPITPSPGHAGGLPPASALAPRSAKRHCPHHEPVACAEHCRRWQAALRRAPCRLTQALVDGGPPCVPGPAGRIPARDRGIPLDARGDPYRAALEIPSPSPDLRYDSPRPAVVCEHIDGCGWGGAARGLSTLGLQPARSDIALWTGGGNHRGPSRGDEYQAVFTRQAGSERGTTQCGDPHGTMGAL